MLLLIRLGPVLTLVIIALGMSFASPYFLTGRNLTNLGFQSAALICLALGQFLAILTRGIDISVGSIVGVVVAIGSILNAHSVPALPAVLCMLMTGAVVGAVNGILLVKGRLPHAFIATLATLGIVRGLAFILTDGNILPGQPQGLQILGFWRFGPIPYCAALAALLALATWYATKRLQWGRWVYAAGGNPEGARRAGIPVDGVLLSIYVLSGLFAAIAGLIVAGQIGVGDANAGVLFELSAIAAVMIGGVSFLGGRGGVSNAVVGALTITVITNGLQLLNVSGHWQQIAIGVSILVAVQLNVMRERFESRLRIMKTDELENRGDAK